MVRTPPRSTRTDTLCPYTTLFRSQRRCVLVGAFRKQGVEQRHVVPHLSQHRGNLDGGERRIRLAAFPLLLVEAEAIGVGALDSEHVPGRVPAARHWLHGLAPTATPAFRALAGPDRCPHFFPSNPHLPQTGQRHTYERPAAPPPPTSPHHYP